MIDANNLSSRVFFTGPVGGYSEKPDYDMMGYIIVDSIYRSMLKTKSNEVIIALDSTNVWRKDIFPRYKESRKKQREKVKIDWSKFYGEQNKIFEDISRYLPFKVLQVDRTEADDVIGVIVLNYKNKSFVIISTDEDYKQLLSKRTKLYQPIKKKWVECSNPEKFIVMKCLDGQSKDGIFNVITPIDWPAEKRKPSLGEEKVRRIIDGGYEDWLVSEGAVERFDLNRKLIDFNCVPENIKKNIIEKYKNYKLPNLEEAYNFFKQRNFKSYLEDFHRVENNLTRLY
jgi:hypothetical protein